MIKKTVTYTDFNGTERTEDFYFNLSRAETIRYEISGENNSWSDKLKQVSESKNGRLIMDTFEEFLSIAYGEKSDDGRFFQKSPEIFARFKTSEAYSQIFMELTTNADVAAAFINGIFPKDMGENPTGLTPRQLSEANLQGHKPKKQDHEANAIVDVPELPTVAPKLTEEKTLDELSPDELRARLAALEASQS